MHKAWHNANAKPAQCQGSSQNSGVTPGANNPNMAKHSPNHSPQALFRMSPSELNTVQEGILITNTDGTILAMNDAITSIFGFKKTEMVGRTCRLLQGPATDPQVLDEMHRAKINGTVFSGEIQSYRKDCAPIWNELTIFPWRNHKNQLTHFVGVLKDITQRKLPPH